MDAADDAAAATTAATIDTAKSLARIDTTVLYPPFVAKLRPLVDACASRSRLYVAIKGERSYAEQAKLYAIGRTTDKQGNPITPDSPAHGHFVTKAPPGTSPHNFNVAVDFSLDSDSDLSNGLQPDDVDEHYRVLAEEAQKLGLDAGFFWAGFQDTPHVALPVRQRGISWAQLDALYKQGGYPAVFAFLDTKGPW